MDAKGGLEKNLYETTAVNEDGVSGVAYIDRKDGLRVIVSSPTSEEPGTNPEELLGLSLSTCFNATIQSLLKARGMDRRSKVIVPIQLKREPSGVGYYFDVEIVASIEGLPIEEAEKIAASAEKRCPVSKLLQGSENVRLTTVPYLD
ncbi:OsmC family protein [Atopococcus tabaci]|uniref:OsmC family protein n=1 Tax=Atopococcus tabaci TaxID=269774 RepID=UPI0003FF5D43|nr:OsmC family protein [Atopococcus tabaci]